MMGITWHSSSFEPSPSKRTDMKKESESNTAVPEEMRELFLHGLKDLYWAENTLVKELPKMAEKASSDELRQAITSHLHETQGHVRRLEEVFKALGEKPEGVKCEGMKGLLDEAKEIVGEFEEGIVRDTAIIGSAQKVEHYEISAYGTLIALAQRLGHQNVVKPLKDTLLEEWSADEKLFAIGQSALNPENTGQKES
jgi:ferritin-like metal-binding protein YciE